MALTTLAARRKHSRKMLLHCRTLRCQRRQLRLQAEREAGLVVVQVEVVWGLSGSAALDLQALAAGLRVLSWLRRLRWESRTAAGGLGLGARVGGVAALVEARAAGVGVESAWDGGCSSHNRGAWWVDGRRHVANRAQQGLRAVSAGWLGLGAAASWVKVQGRAGGEYLVVVPCFEAWLCGVETSLLLGGLCYVLHQLVQPFLICSHLLLAPCVIR